MSVTITTASASQPLNHARELFEQLDAEVTTVPPDMGTVLTVAARNDVEVVLAG